MWKIDLFEELALLEIKYREFYFQLEKREIIKQNIIGLCGKIDKLVTNQRAGEVYRSQEYTDLHNIVYALYHRKTKFNFSQDEVDKFIDKKIRIKRKIYDLYIKKGIKYYWKLLKKIFEIKKNEDE